MAELYLIRHGQASYGAANYDKLSELGHQQARWLGEYYRRQGIEFGHVLTGNMVRQRETATGICEGLGVSSENFDTHLGLNEFDFDAISSAYLKLHPEHRPAEDAHRNQFYQVLKKAMLSWSRDELPGELPESWSQFEARVRDALTHIQSLSDKKRILVVSSGGAMAMAMSIVLQTAPAAVIELNLQTRNTGVSHYFFNRNVIRLSGFNNTPHLDDPEFHHAVTFS